MKPNPFHVLPPSNRERDIAGVVRVLLSIYPNKPVVVSWKIAKPDRTAQQNRYLWAVPYRMLKEATGHDETELHEYNCGEYWGWKSVKCLPTPTNPDGVTSVPNRTTTTGYEGERDICPMEDFVALWEKAQKWGAGLGIVIPDPDPDYWKVKSKEAA